MLRSGRDLWGPALLALLTVATLSAIASERAPLLRGPSPYPPEWQWERRVSTTGGRPAVALASGAGLLSLLALSAGRRRVSGGGAALFLCGATLLGWSFQLGLLDLEAGGALRHLLARTLSRTWTSYHAVATSPAARSPLDFLRHHAELLPDLRGSAKHAATHPPGPVLYYRGLVAVCERSPRLTGLLVDLVGDVAPRTSPPAKAAGLLGALLLGLLGAATAWPVAALVQQATGDPLAAARAGVLWNLLPGPALMTPQFDQALALPVAATATLLAAALVHRGGSAGAAARAVLAGLSAGLALFVSYGAAAFLFVGGLAALALAGAPARSGRTIGVIGLALAAVAVVIGLTVLLSHHPLASARAAFAIHEDEYTRPRSYWLWLFFNPLDLAVFLGIPVAALGVVRLLRSAVALVKRASSPSEGAAAAQRRLRLAVGAAVLLLVLSGATRGEVGRIWIPLMPFLLVASVDARDGSEALFAGALLVPICMAIRLCWVV